MSAIADELALRAGQADSDGWDAVLAVYLAGLDQWPQPFTARPPDRAAVTGPSGCA